MEAVNPRNRDAGIMVYLANTTGFYGKKFIEIDNLWLFKLRLFSTQNHWVCANLTSWIHWKPQEWRAFIISTQNFHHWRCIASGSSSNKHLLQYFAIISHTAIEAQPTIYNWKPNECFVNMNLEGALEWQNAAENAKPSGLVINKLDIQSLRAFPLVLSMWPCTENLGWGAVVISSESTGTLLWFWKNPQLPGPWRSPGRV
jgi:hypothetical protein